MTKYICECCGKCYVLDYMGEEIPLPPEDDEISYDDYNDRTCEECIND